MNIIWLDDPGCQEVARVGGKVANLSRLASTYQVPTGFCLTTAAFQEWARHEDGRDDEFPRSCWASLPMPRANWPDDATPSSPAWPCGRRRLMKTVASHPLPDSMRPT